MEQLAPTCDISGASSLPALPTLIDPDVSLSQIHGQHFVREARTNGTVRIGGGSYSIHTNMIGQ